MFGIKKNKNNLNDNLSGNKFVSDNNTIKVKGDNVTNYYGKLNKNDKIEFANKIAETEYNVDVLERKILGCPSCKMLYSTVINNTRDSYDRNGVALMYYSDIDILLYLNNDNLHLICNECKKNMEELRKLKYQLKAYNKMISKK